MSLYNLLHGVNPLKDVFLKMLGIDQKVENKPKFPNLADCWSYDYDNKSKELEESIQQCIERKIWISGRFRDIYLNKDGTKIILYTRNGGENREEYQYVFSILEKHPNYLCNYNDKFDNTYAYIEFSVPEKYQEFCKKIAPQEEPKTIHEKFQETMEEMEKMQKEDIEKDERFKPIIEIFKDIEKDKEGGKTYKI